LGAIKNKPRKYRFHGTGKSQTASSKEVAVPHRNAAALPHFTNRSPLPTKSPAPTSSRMILDSVDFWTF
jgi:hypothetical protein